jgi:2-polyprenyl-3-methyl-5-hydroxy-6-metoxy-1,4-benzoquinol methylase
MFLALILFALLSADPIWDDFSAWFSAEGTPGAPAEVLNVYAGKLKSRGLPPTEIDQRVASVRKYLADNPRQALALHFDRIYTWADAPFSRQPSDLVTKVASNLKPGKALDIAMGQGRNAIWLAKAGWTVSGYDISPEALRQAGQAASSAGVSLDTKLASHDEYPLGESQWDLIVMSFAFTRLSDAGYMKRVHASIKPGGVLLIEGFNGGPRRDDRNMILKAFLDYRVLLFEDLPDVADWGKVKAPLLRMALEKR